MTNETLRSRDEVLGYKLVRKLGSGGYGEVWEADAPGGLKKAIKFVFGYHDEKRAMAELKALDRIKQARHPFLLSLERIEIHKSQLVIVTELADKSLADAFDEHIQAGLTGIPREALLTYMRDSADALDYLAAEFSLQHLDIKPENLLIIADHAKVADFGLVKDLHDASQSLMSGMTPAYAAPELFDGRPGPQSDQYSLAIVYQEMLTSNRPFPGTTPAQLAAQHMHGKPNLKHLSPSDQPVIAKALSKDPKDRYKTCREMIDELINRKSRKKVVKGRASIRQRLETDGKTVVVDDDGTHVSRSVTAMMADGLSFKSVDMEYIASPNFSTDDAIFQPTLVVGVGRSGSQAVQHVKRRLIARYGSMESLPSFELLCIDTDRETLARMSMNRSTCNMTIGETLMIPLRRPEKYRQQDKLDLSWISRRWIYNVPRSLQTEGLRPLGRLAFTDHFEDICNRISDKIKSAVRIENVTATVESLGMNPPKKVTPNVIIVSSICGGLGSGMTNDLAYTTRLMLAENGISESNVIGMLLHGTDRGSRDKGLTNANAYAFLTELRHFTDHGYPGDKRLGIPEFHDELPFDHTYFLKASEENEENKSRFSLDSIAEYICLNTATNCSIFFDTCRELDRESEEFRFRSFGLSISGPGNQISTGESVQKLARSLTDKWINQSPKVDFKIDGFATAQLQKLNLNMNQVTEKVIATVSKLKAWKPTEMVIKDSLRLVSSSKPAHEVIQKIEHHFDEFYDCALYRDESNGLGTDLGCQTDAVISREAQMTGDRLAEELLNLLQMDEISFPMISGAIEACRTSLTVEQVKIDSGLEGSENQIESLKNEFLSQASEKKRKKPSMSNHEFTQQYGQLRFQEFILRSCRDYFRLIQSCLVSVVEMMKKYKMQIELVGSEFNDPTVEDVLQLAEYGATIEQFLIRSAENNYENLTRQVEMLVVDQMRQDREGFLEVLSESSSWQNSLPNAIRDAAQSVLSQSFKKISIDRAIKENNIERPMVISWLREQLGLARPSVSNCGGNTRLLVGLPMLSDQSELPEMMQEEFELPLRAINGTAGDFVVCFETEQILLANLAFRILEDSPEVPELAKRIHSRDDIDWTSLKDLI